MKTTTETSYGECPTCGKYHICEIRYKKRKLHLVSQERFLCGGKYSDWGDVNVAVTPLRANRKCLPPMSDAERDAWADEVFYLLQHHEVLTAHTAGLHLPGWDDVTHFDPKAMTSNGYVWPREPHTNPELPARYYQGIDPFYYHWRPAQRATALAGMALRRLCKQGRAVESGLPGQYLIAE